MAERVETVLSVDGTRIHRFQVVRERRVDEGTATGRGEAGNREEWIVVGFEDATGVSDQGDEGDEDREGAATGDQVRLADPEFEWTRSVPVEAFRTGKFEPLSAGGVPIWGY